MTRGLAALAATVVAIAVTAGVASAHVTIDTLGAVEQGSFAKLGLSVPNERDDSSTVKVQVQLPQDHPLVFVSVQPKAGWDITTTTRTLDAPVEAFGSTFSEVTDTITWTASGDTKIGPGQYDQFWISAGAMPTDSDTLQFPAVQTYSDGEIVSWIEPTPAGGEEPEHPIPTLHLVAAGTGNNSDPDDSATPASTPGSTPAATIGGASGTNASDDGSGDDDGNGLAIVALVVGALGLVAGAVGIGIARKATAAIRTPPQAAA